jgi:G:T/U-mismatch repair DNA glycosylase
MGYFSMSRWKYKVNYLDIEKRSTPSPPVSEASQFSLKSKKETWREYPETLTKKGTPCTIKKG